MYKKSITGGIVLLFLLSSLIPFVSSNEISTNNIIYVDDDGGADYTRIQDAIDNSSNGDTVFVFGGIYYERIVIDKSIILQGENRNTTVIDGSKKGTVVFIEEGFVNVSGFSIQNSGSSGLFNSGILVNSSYNYISDNNFFNNWYGIRLNVFTNNTILVDNFILEGTIGIYLDSYSDNNTLCNNTIIDARDGIYLFGSSNNTIRENYVSKNRFGIELYSSYEFDSPSSDNNQILRNDITYNSGQGITISFSNNNIVDNNIIQNNSGDGVSIECADNNTILNNDIYNNHRGIGLYTYSNDTFISHNNIFDNEIQGIYLVLSFNNSIEKNNISNNHFSGIVIHESVNNSIEENNITGNNEYGVALAFSSNNNMIKGNFINDMNVGIIYHNVCNNTANRNIISDNQEYGIYVEYFSNNNTFSENSITYNRNGTYFHNSSDNIINYNNFIKNKRTANFKDCRNNWNNNYWNRPRILPYLIFGKIDNRLKIEIDRHPRLLPYSSPSGEV